MTRVSPSIFSASSSLASRLRPPGEVAHVVACLRRRGFEAFLVGGALRDALLGLPTRDWDVATEAPCQVVMSMFPKVIPTGIRHGTLTVVLGQAKVEVSTFRGADILEDLGHRDLTINALAWDPSGASILDPFGGLRDLRSKLVRGVGDPLARLEEDPLRAIRAFRICGELGFRMHRETFLAIARAARGLERVSPERIREELTRILLAPRPSFPLRGMSKSGTLQVVLPELTGSPKASRSGRSRRLERVFRSVDLLPPQASLRWAALLRGIRQRKKGPGETGLDGLSGRGRFLGGAARMVLSRLRFSRREIRHVTELIAHTDLLVGVLPSDASVRHLVATMGIEGISDALALLRAELTAGCAAATDLARIPELEARVEALVRCGGSQRLRPVLGGAEVMEILGIPPGPPVGQILRSLQDLVIQDPSSNDREYLAEWLRRGYSGEGH